MHTYMLVFEHHGSESLQVFHDKICSLDTFELIRPNVWIIKSELSSQEICNDLSTLFADKDFFITEIIPEHSAGRLYEETRERIFDIVQNPKVACWSVRD